MCAPAAALTPALTATYVEQMAAAAGDQARVEIVARWILDAFRAYYGEYRTMPQRARAAFESRDWNESVALSKRRLALYSDFIDALGPDLKAAYPSLGEDETLWWRIESIYLPLIRRRYSADLAYAFLNSAHRRVYQGEWKPVAYGFGSHLDRHEADHPLTRVFPGGAALTAQSVSEILTIPGFTVPWRDRPGDAARVAERVNRDLGLPDEGAGMRGAVYSVEMVDAGFFRNRGAYLVGRIVLRGTRAVPLIVALLNEGEGIYVDAVLTSEADAHNIFSSTLANFHVTSDYYHELSSLLRTIMPRRPLGLHYSTVGFNHLGKVAVMNELSQELAGRREVLCTAPGYRGTVAMGFCAPSSAYNLKVIRDHPTRQYKWGEFAGIESVLDKYRQVHRINRTGSMLDNIIYYNLKLATDWFDPELLEELLREASATVSRHGDAVILKYLIVQRRLTPLPLFVTQASVEDARTAIVNLGHCIKNNAAANIYNKDLDARNYGVSPLLKVYLFDYDALEPLTEVKVRSNEDRLEGEEDVPDWYFEEGVVFLPEELEAGLMLQDRALRRVSRAVHGDLMNVAYWEGVQRALVGGRVPPISVYPEEARLAP